MQVYTRVQNLICILLLVAATHLYGASQSLGVILHKEHSFDSDDSAILTEYSKIESFETVHNIVRVSDGRSGRIFTGLTLAIVPYPNDGNADSAEVVLKRINGLLGRFPQHARPLGLLQAAWSSAKKARLSSVKIPASSIPTASTGESLRTLSGGSYEHVVVSRVESDGISIIHSGGVAKIPFTDLPDTIRKKYGYDPQKAAAYAAASERALQANAQQQVEQAKQAKLKELMQKLRDAGLQAEVRVTQVLENGILGDASYFNDAGYDVSWPGEKGKHRAGTQDPLGFIFVLTPTKGMADDEIWRGKVWEAGTYRYTSVGGSSKTVRRYVTSPEEAIAMMRSEGKKPNGE